jgi:flagellar basal body rod protein FlgG
MDAISISALSMQNDLRKLDMVSHNVANLTTPGYKRAVSSTESFISTVSRLESPQQAVAVMQNALPTLKSTTDFRTASLQSTSNPLDLAIEGDGFFELVNNTGTFYSKRGNFVLDNKGQLALSGSDLLLNSFSGDIRLQTDEPEIDSQGRVFENGQEIAQIKIVSFENPSALVGLGKGIYELGETAPGIQDVELPSIRQAFLEASNTQPAEEMLTLMQLSRHIEATQQVIRGYDDMLATVFEDLGKF